MSFTLGEFPEGLSNFVVVDEIRAGVSPIDPRGTWALGLGAASITGAHPGGPNYLEYGDGVTSCGHLILLIGKQELRRMKMPCVTSPIPASYSATARSQHSGVVNTLRLDGSVEAISDSIDQATWLKLHSRSSDLAQQLSGLRQLD